MTTHTVEVSLRTITRILLVVLAAFFLLAIRDLLTLFLLSVVLASGISPIVSWFERRGVPRLAGLLLVVLVAGSVLVLLLYAVVPPLLRQIQDFVHNFPSYQRLFVRGLQPIGIEPSGAIGQGVSQGLQELGTLLGKGVASLPALTLQIFGGVFSAASVLLVTFYLSLQRDGVESLIRLFLPDRGESYIVDLWRRAQSKIGSWARGQLLLMFLIGVTVFFGLTLLQVRYALLLALVAALFEVVPIIGPVVAGAAGVAVAAFQSAGLAAAVLVFYIVVQQVEGHVIVPLLYRRILGLNPVVVIFSLLIGAQLGGIVGVFLAMPVAAAIMEFLNDYSKGKIRL